MESLKEYRPSIINKLKLFFNRIEQRKTIEKDLDKLALDGGTSSVMIENYKIINDPINSDGS